MWPWGSPVRCEHYGAALAHHGQQTVPKKSPCTWVHACGGLVLQRIWTLSQVEPGYQSLPTGALSCLSQSTLQSLCLGKVQMKPGFAQAPSLRPPTAQTPVHQCSAPVTLFPSTAHSDPAFTHQKDHSWVTNQSQGCRQLPFVASTVGTRGSVCIVRKTQAHQARERGLWSKAR